MGKGKRRSKKKKAPQNTGFGGSAEAVAPSRAAGAAKDAPVMSRGLIECDNCGVANPQKRCTICLCYYYCSKECQRANWKHHKECCTKLKEQRDHYNAARDRSNLPGETPAVIDGPCAICLEEEVKHPVTFECGHAFCFECVFRYQCEEEQPACPYCRGEIPDVLEKAGDRLSLYLKRAASAVEESKERKKYCHLAMAECDAVSQTREFPQCLLYLKAKIVSLSKDPEALLKITDKILVLVSHCGDFELDHEMVVRTKVWRAQAYSEMGKWTDASEIYSGLRREDLGEVWNWFLLELGHCRCLFELGDYHKAVEYGIRAVSMCRSEAGVHEYLALALKAAGNIDAAKKTMSRAILHEEPWNIENKKKNKQILMDLGRDAEEK